MQGRKKIIDQVLAMHDKMKTFYAKGKLHFNSGDRFLITTDGYVDQVGHDHSSDRRRAFGFQRLLQLLRENRAHFLAFNMQALQTNLQAWQGEGLRRDDITLLAVQLQR